MIDLADKSSTGSKIPILYLRQSDSRVVQCFFSMKFHVMIVKSQYHQIIQPNLSSMKELSNELIYDLHWDGMMFLYVVTLVVPACS